MPKGNRWEDHFARRSRAENWLARSVYKLEEIDRKSRLFRKGDRILDLGCYPGSWSQYCLKKVGPGGEVVGVDLKRPERISAPNFKFLEADVFQLEPEELRDEFGPMDAVISDMAPNTTGIGDVDVGRSMALCRRALGIAGTVLKKRGHFLCKLFEGGEIGVYKEEASIRFERVRVVRPSAVRKGSREVYVLCLGRKL